MSPTTRVGAPCYRAGTRKQIVYSRHESVVQINLILDGVLESNPKAIGIRYMQDYPLCMEVSCISCSKSDHPHINEPKKWPS